MKLWSRINSLLRNLFRKQQVERQLDDELRAYVDMITDERIAAGMPASEARRFALAEFGGIEQVKQTVRDNRAGASLELLWQDARYGLRQFWRNPGFTAMVILTLALSIGANTAIFSIVNALMLKSLPYSHPERMGTIYTRVTGPRGLRRAAPREWGAMGTAARRGSFPDSGCVGHTSFRHQSPGRIARAVPFRGARIGTLLRRAGDPSHPRTQFLG
jgi:hypothetical protein